MDGALRYAFEWPRRVIKCAQQCLATSTIDRSAFLLGQGSDSDFSGGAAGWEVASDNLAAEAADWCYEVDLGTRSTCATGTA